MLLAIEILSLLTMVTVMFVFIWGFILLNRIFNQLRYKNYILEKLTQNVYMLTKNKDDETQKI